MKLVLLFVLVLLWHWVCALPCPSCSHTNASIDANSPEVQSYKNADHHHVQELNETEKTLLSTVSGIAKNATSYINRNFHEIDRLEEVDEPAESGSFIRPKKSTKQTTMTNEVKNDLSSTKIIENDLKNSTKTEKGNSFKNNTKQVLVAKNNLDYKKNITDPFKNNTKQVPVAKSNLDYKKNITDPFKNNTKQVPIANNNLDGDKNSTKITENPVKNSTKNDKEVSLRNNIMKVSVPQNNSKVDINKTKIIEDDLKNTTKSEKGVYLRNSSKEVSIAQNDFEVDKNKNEIIHHHHNPSSGPKASIARIKRDTNENAPRRYLPTIRGRSGQNVSEDVFDSRYILVHDIPPFRRKRAFEDDHLESCDLHKAKNITIIIQNFLNDLGDESSTTSFKPKSNSVSYLHRTRRSSYFQQDEIGNQPYQAVDGDSENGIELKDDGEEKPKDFVDANSQEDADKNLQNDVTESAVKKDSNTETNNFEENWKMRYRYYENLYQGPVPVAETKIKVLKRLKCTCVTMGEDLSSDDTSKPLIENYFVNTLESSAAINQETLCLMACEEQVQHHFQPKQMIFCAPLAHLDAHIPATNPLNIVSERSETIICKTLPVNVNPPLQCMTYWLNMTFVEVALLMACCVVSLYGLCFILSKKKKSIPLYVATSAASK